MCFTWTVSVAVSGNKWQGLRRITIYLMQFDTDGHIRGIRLQNEVGLVVSVYERKDGEILSLHRLYDKSSVRGIG